MSNPKNYFKKGQSGNPNGAPKKDNSWRALSEAACAEIIEKTGDRQIVELAKNLKIEKKTFKEAIAVILRRKALTGDLTAIKMLQDRMEGMPKQSVEQVGAIKVKYEDKSDSDI